MRTYDNVLAAGLILNIAYGYNVRDCEDPLIGIADEATRNTVKAGGPGAMLCDMFPLCKLTMRGSQIFCYLDVDSHDTFAEGSKAPAYVVPICPVQTARGIHKGTCVQDVRHPLPVGQGPDCKLLRMIRS